MPRRRIRSYAKKFKGGKRKVTKRAAAPKRRRLQGMGYQYLTAAGAAGDAAYRLRGSRERRRRITGKIGRPKVDAATGGAGGFRFGKRKPMGRVIRRRKATIAASLASTAYPVIRDHQMAATSQIDWASDTQACQEYSCGFTTSELQDMLTQSASASSITTAAMVTPTVGTLKNQRMDFYDKTTKFNFKNTCSHTVYVEIRAYRSKIYHGYNVLPSWQLALDSDNMVQNPTSFGTEENYYNIGKRPDMRLADLDVRWKYLPNATYKITLEPGQETSYTYIQCGARFDQERFNVLQGTNTTGDDISLMPKLSTNILVFARSELVVDAIDTDVTFGSGHLAVNKEVWKSWSAVPYVKPYQTSFQSNWGTVLEANELDLNQYKADQDAYEEQV